MKQIEITGTLKAVLLRLIPTYAAKEYPSGTAGCLAQFNGTFCHRDEHEGDPYHVRPSYPQYGPIDIMNYSPALVWMDQDEPKTD